MFARHPRRYRVLPSTRARQVAQDLELIQWKHVIHALAEVDVTLARQLLVAYRARTGWEFSFTAWVVSCAARAVKEQPHMQTYRQLRSLGIRSIPGASLHELILPHVILTDANPRAADLCSANLHGAILRKLV